MKTYLIMMVLFATSITLATQSFAGPNCTCRYKGQNVPEGQSACIKTAEGYRVAQCSRVLNNPSWKFTKQECPIG